MIIDPSIRGNGTRYINHDCRAKTFFFPYSCGEKILTCVLVSEQTIEFDEGNQLLTERGVASTRGWLAAAEKINVRCGMLRSSKITL